MKQGKYENLREVYPEYISKVQLYQICKISPRSAQYLLDNGIIPFADTGKSTWRYKIALTDVIIYLRKREQVGSMIPCGSVTSDRKPTSNPIKSFSDYIVMGDKTKMLEYFTFVFNNYPDVLSLADIVEMTGVAKETVRKFINESELNTLGFRNGKHVVPKQYLLEFVISDKFLRFKSNSASFKKVLGGFEIWKAAR